MIDIPPLRDRGEDKLLLANYFLRKFAQEYDRPVMKFSKRAISAIDSYNWPGNVRELISKVRSAVVFTDTRHIDSQDLELKESEKLPLNLDEIRLATDRAAINKVLTITTGRATKAAQLLGVTRQTLYSMMKKCNINSQDFKNKKMPPHVRRAESEISRGGLTCFRSCQSFALAATNQEIKLPDKSNRVRVCHGNRHRGCITASLPSPKAKWKVESTLVLDVSFAS